MEQIILSNFGDPDVNGTYNEIGVYSGYPLYKKTTNDYIIIYKTQYGPYSFSPAYWIIKINNGWNNVNGLVPFYQPKYKSTDTYVVTATWTSLVDNTSGEETIGYITDYSSSSSSIDSSSSSSSDSSSSSSSSIDSSSSSSSGV